jgi:pectate lyase
MPRTRIRRTLLISAGASILAAAGLLAGPTAGARAAAGPAPAADALAASTPNPATTAPPTGWASVDGGTTGGAGAASADTYVVTNRAQLLTALANHGQPDAPKIIYVEGTIYGNQAADGRLLGEQDFAPGYSVKEYLSCFTGDGAQWSNTVHSYCPEIGSLQAEGVTDEGARIVLSVPSNTTLLGVGANAGFTQADLSFSGASNIIIRNLHFVSPRDFFTTWTPSDFTDLFTKAGQEGSWNADFQALTFVDTVHVWIDHDVFTDDPYPDSQAPIAFHGEHVNFHDEEVDIKEGSDFFTISYDQFRDNEKTILIGSSDNDAASDSGHLRVTFIGNLFDDTDQRSPRVRFGEVQLVNNYYTGSVNAEYPILSYTLKGPSYFIGIGYQAKIYSDYNSFNYSGPGSGDSIITWNWGGTQFYDQGSWYNGEPVNVEAQAAKTFQLYRNIVITQDGQAGTQPPPWTQQSFSFDIGWNPANYYQYQPLANPAAVGQLVQQFSGTGRITVLAPGPAAQ